MKKIRLVIAIDPGKSGGIAKYYEDNRLEYCPIPVIGTEYDVHQIVDLLSPNENEEVVHVCIENVHAIQGRVGNTSQFNFGFGKGILVGICAGLGLRFTQVAPTVWQKVAWEGVTKQSDTKKTSLIAAKRLFPNESFLGSERSRKPHDGIVDAVLMAYYTKLKFM